MVHALAHRKTKDECKRTDHHAGNGQYRPHFLLPERRKREPDNVGRFGAMRSASRVGHAITRPSFKNTIRFAVFRASSSSCVTMISVVPA